MADDGRASVRAFLALLLTIGIAGCVTTGEDLARSGITEELVLGLERDEWRSPHYEEMYGAGSRPVAVRELRCAPAVYFSGDYQCYYRVEYERDGAIRAFRRSKVLSRDENGAWVMPIIVTGS